MKISAKQVLGILYIFSWIIFAGVCVEAGGFIFNTVYDLVRPIGARNFWEGMDLSPLYHWDRGYFLVETSLMCLVAVMRAWIFYLIIRILHNKKLDLSQPFNQEVGRFISMLSYLSLMTGVLAQMGTKYAEWFVQQGVKMPDVHYLRLGGADVWLFMGVTLFVIAHIFKRGIEIQSENELTV